MSISKIESVFNYCFDNPEATNDEIAKALNMDVNIVKTYISRLKSYGYLTALNVESKRVIEVLKPFRVGEVKTTSDFKEGCYREMVDVLLEDFRACETYKERLEVGNIIRLILKEF